ncbi:hypothetical protein NECAME_06383 [Necator americanus]|uniref:Uncharacterized protein n=1 Tax=Necator americanus TaxID=51031 RepID=W2TTN1_NECAM|nr:hypothetical protein NECAME_06383 [Necator americanus]ETN85430.1 hypothetical protein NECAME_06383 [Necator americanus]
MDFIDFEMHRVIRVPLHQIYDVDPALCELLCNAFFGRTKCWKREDVNDISSQGYDMDLWPNCKFHLYAGVLCMYACVVMEKLFRGVHDEYMARLYEENRSSFEHRAVDLLNDIFRENASIALNVLEIDYERIFKGGEAGFFEGGQDFLAHNCCQSLIERRWHGRLRLSPENSFVKWSFLKQWSKPPEARCSHQRPLLARLIAVVRPRSQALIPLQGFDPTLAIPMLEVKPTRTLISYLFPCFIYKEFALRKARGPELRKATIAEEPVEPPSTMEELINDQNGRLLSHVSKNPGFANAVDLDTPRLVAAEASTPTSMELEYLQKPSILSTRRVATPKNVMKCPRVPKFPVKERDLCTVHSSGDPSPSIIERIAQSTVFPTEEEQKRDSPIYDRFDLLPHYIAKKPLWLWSTLKFYTTTKAKFFYHVVFRVAYVILYSWVLVAKPRRRSSVPNISNYWPELLVALVQLSQLCDGVVGIRQRKKNKKSLFHSRLRDLLNSSSQEEGSSPEGRILNAQALFQNIFNILMECIQEETGQIRTRANTAVGDLQNHLHHCGSNSMPDLLKG